MRIFSRLTLIAVAALALGSCQKQVEYSGRADVQPVLPDPITATVQGNVLDENGQPATNVTVRVGNKTAQTDSRGNFRILAASLDKKQALVTAEKSGYFKAYRSFGATSGANAVQIKLIRRSLAGTVNGGTGGDASLSNGSKVALPANGVVDAATGAAYSGAVSVYAAYIDPSSQDIAQVIPGSFTANDKDGRRVTLTSYGMLAVELEGAGGHKLQIKSGSNAVLTTAIPTAAQGNAPATIPMWFVDETTGIWKEQGTATKVGNTYVGNVPHFSFWNCDVSANAVQVTVTIHGPNGQPLINTYVRLRRNTTQWSSFATGVTDSLGQVSGYVPSNEGLVLELLDRCWQPFYTQNVGPFTANTTIPTITATVPVSQNVTITGTVTNCAGNPVSSGYAIVYVDNWASYVTLNSNGAYVMSYVGCGVPSGNVTVIGVDNSNQVQSGPATATIVAGAVTLPAVTACGTSSAEFINYSVDGGSPVSFAVTVDSVMLWTRQIQGTTLWSTSISGSRMNSSNQSISINFDSAPAAGTYNTTYFQVNSIQSASSSASVTVTAWPSTVGSFMEATFTGSYVDGTGTHSVTGSYRLRRNF